VTLSVFGLSWLFLDPNRGSAIIEIKKETPDTVAKVPKSIKTVQISGRRYHREKC